MVRHFDSNEGVLTSPSLKHQPQSNLPDKQRCRSDLSEVHACIFHRWKILDDRERKLPRKVPDNLFSCQYSKFKFNTYKIQLRANILNPDSIHPHKNRGSSESNKNSDHKPPQFPGQPDLIHKTGIDPHNWNWIGLIEIPDP